MELAELVSRLQTMLTHKQMILHRLEDLKDGVVVIKVSTNGEGDWSLRTDDTHNGLDKELVVLVSDLVASYYTQRLSSLDFLLGLANEALVRDLGKQLILAEESAELPSSAWEDESQSSRKKIKRKSEDI